jgi:hypothetical protein
MANLTRVNFIALMLLLGGCATVPPPVTAPVPCTPAPTAVKPPAPPVTPNLQPADWNALPGWNDDQELAAWDSWLQSCSALKAKPDGRRYVPLPRI